MIHPNTEVRFVNEQIGYGLFATDRIPKGTITWVLDELDRVFTPEQYENLDERHQLLLDKYSYRNNRGHLVLCWDAAKYVNHSFNSNCLTTAYDFELAIRDIEKGEQITDDYGYLNVDKPFRALEEGTKRKIVYPDDLLRFHGQWDKKLLRAFQYFSMVNQPLKPFLKPEMLETVLRIESGTEKMKSILTNYYG